MTNISRTGAAAGQDAQAAPARRAGVDRAWQHAMEKAQARDWFHGAIGQGATLRLPGWQQAGGEARNPSRAPEDGMDSHEAPSGAMLPGGAPSMPQPAAPAPSLPQPLLAAGATTSQALAWCVALQVPPSGPEAGGAVVPRPAPCDTEAVTPAAPLSDPQTPPAPVRVHVEDGPGGLRVWFGLDGDAASLAARAQALVQELRRECGSTGRRLALVVCNGNTLWAADAGSATARAPAPSLSSLPQEP